MNQRFAPNLRQLRAFLAIYRLRKLGAAAEQLCITQSAVSVLLRQLEEGWGTTLFDRTTRSLRPTEAAEAALEVVERILRDVDSLGAGIGNLAALRHGRISLAITPNLAQLLLPPVIEAFHARHPGVQLRIDDCAPDQFLSRVVGEHVDFGIGTPEQSGGEVELSTLIRDHLCVVCRPDHPLAALRRVRWRDLDGHDVIAGRPGYGVRHLVDASAARAGVALRVVHEMSFQSTGVWLARSGLGVAIMPSAYAAVPPGDTLAVRPLTQPAVSRDLYLVTRRGRSLSPASAAFVKALRERWTPAESPGSPRPRRAAGSPG